MLRSLVGSEMCIRDRPRDILLKATLRGVLGVKLLPVALPDQSSEQRPPMDWLLVVWQPESPGQQQEWQIPSRADESPGLDSRQLLRAARALGWRRLRLGVMYRLASRHVPYCDRSRTLR
eukprot:TRINITY_DN64054_c0_g1_i1.p2 TRINITY_DN64054_c0_g1~~TRINITY_DN64054_c0_g1_i1.p2  ORF type:complete len:120 (+),score=20.15 TRINITY_DN64054_c0_g1_i1:93-452(+)